MNIFIVTGYRVNATILYAGSGYTPSSTVPITIDPPPGGGTTATGYGNIDITGALQSITFTSHGFGYYTPPNIVIDPPPAGTQATATTSLFCEAGNAPYPSPILNFQEDIIMFNPWIPTNDGDYAFSTMMAHEVGHCLDLTHTYNGVNCNGGDTYLDDVFGSPPPGNCPHIYDWNANPLASTTDRITNNMMSGNKHAHYFSPLQMGRMHRALALKSIRQYLNNCVYDQLNPWQVNSNEVLDFDMQFDKDIIIDNNSTLEITCKLSMPNGSKIIVNPGSTLIIDGVVTNNCDGAWDGLIDVKENATLHLKGDAEVHLKGNGKIFIEGNTNGDATMIYDAGADIFLENINTHIEIQGNLQLTDNANFTFNYGGNAHGYVKFSSTHPLPLNVQTGINCSMSFVGSNQILKVLEVDQEGLYPPSNLVNFTIQDGTARHVFIPVIAFCLWDGQLL